MTTVARPREAGMFVAAGCVALLARPLAWRTIDNPTGVLVLLFAALLGVGVLWPVRRPPVGARALSVPAVAAIGIGAFALGRLLAPGIAPSPFTVRFVVLNSLAAVAEEAFFRRFVFAALARYGDTAAIVGSSALFAVVHGTVYGWWVLPVDLAAGLVLSWQRYASGSWLVAAGTHVLANGLMVV